MSKHLIVYYFIILVRYIFVLEELTSRHLSLTESEFDSAVAEWLRFAKQRKEREDKMKNNHENNEEQP